MTWAQNRDDFLGKMQPARLAQVEIIRRLTRGERVRLLVNDKRTREQARSLLARSQVDLDRVDLLICPTNRCWQRDFGPIFLKKGTRRAIKNFRFNGWARFRAHSKDDAVASWAAKRMQAQLLPAFRDSDNQLVLEGGAIDVNGDGALLTTRECLLDQTTQVRNRGADRDEMTRLLCEHVGVDQVIWLNRGIAGDDTHGHVDDVARFVSDDTVVIAQEPDSAHENHAPLAENRRILESVRLRDAGRLQIVDLPMPESGRFGDVPLAKSYANFYIANACVLVPTFCDPADREALGILAELFPDRTVVGIHALDLVLGGGTIHCITQQEPL
jgi:agmatine deiminase